MGAHALNGRGPGSSGRGGGPADPWQHETLRERDGADRHPLHSGNDSSSGELQVLPPRAAGRRIGLPDQRTLEDELRRCIDRATQQGRPFALLLIDLDRIERLRQDIGRTGVDQVLARVAHRLRGAIGSTEMAAHRDDDGFAVLLVETTSRDDATHRARRILAAVGRPIEVDGRYLMVSASVGAALFGADGGTAEDLTRAATAALALARRNGGRQVVISAGG
jgi:diguanylate cyclase (GGDEF)-like protein